MLIDILFAAIIKFFEENLKKLIWLIRLKKTKTQTRRHADVYFSYFPKSTKVFAQVYKVDQDQIYYGFKTIGANP